MAGGAALLFPLALIRRASCSCNPRTSKNGNDSTLAGKLPESPPILPLPLHREAPLVGAHAYGFLRPRSTAKYSDMATSIRNMPEYSLCFCSKLCRLKVDSPNGNKGCIFFLMLNIVSMHNVSKRKN